MPFLTPSSVPTDLICVRVQIPDSIEWQSLVSGALAELLRPYNWEKFGFVSVVDAVEAGTRLQSSMRIMPCMIGQVFSSVRETAENGTLPCDGSEYSGTDYPDLYAVLPSGLKTFGGNFVTPDLRGRAVVGSGTGTGLTARALLDTGGLEEVGLSIDNIEEHRFQIDPHTHLTAPHSHIDAGHTHTEQGSITAAAAPPVPPLIEPSAIPLPSVTGVGFANLGSEVVVVEESDTLFTNYLGDGAPHENMQPFYVLNWYIVAR